MEKDKRGFKYWEYITKHHECQTRSFIKKIISWEYSSNKFKNFLDNACKSSVLFTEIRERELVSERMCKRLDNRNVANTVEAILPM